MTESIHRIRSFVGIVGGIALGFVFALDITGWYFTKPVTLALMEFIGALLLFRITHGLMQDERISPATKRGYLWSVSGLIIAHIVNLTYIYLKDLQASFNIMNIDFAESLAMSWAYLHFTVLGYILGALSEYVSNYRERNRARIREIRLKAIEDDSSPSVV